jgi:hypothetical protein
MARKFDLSKILLLAAVLAFVLAALDVEIGDLDLELIPIGLALGFGSFLV